MIRPRGLFPRRPARTVIGVATALLACGALAAAPSAARADVLSITPQGSTWISGPLQTQLPTGAPVPGTVSRAEIPGEIPGQVEAAAEMLGAVSLPAEAHASPERHAAIIPAAYAAHINELALRFDLSPALIEALVWQESRWNPRAVSPAGARGLTQLMPATARYLGVDPDDPFQNLEGGARYLREQLDRFDGDLERALAAYNAGPGRVERAGGIPRIRETQHYVSAILGRLSDHSRSVN